ncbi:phosphatase PAP2 family protein [Hydrogenophaga sp.]|uniref:phosphatase PAP2 family protein n=1 Tax=Hydrogenophaga sp. TaxID=1904254 RepID=UPI002606A05B|nr:phosphatase PAP2 family protein [Hydrogenophaga sp.]
MATALIMSRDGTMVRDSHLSSGAQCLKAHPQLDDPATLLRWDRWVRASLVQSALNEGLSFSADMPDGIVLQYGGQALFALQRPSVECFTAQLPLVECWAQLREDRMAEILAQIDNQTAFIAAVTGLNLERHRWTFEWLSAALSLVIPVEVRFKHALGCQRPVEYSPQIQPIITTPGHGTYPMGHAAQAFMLADILQSLLCLGDAHPTAVQLQRQAVRISVNRVVAGVHFPIDAIPGRWLGRTMAEFFLRKCGVQQVVEARACLFADLEVCAAARMDFPNARANPESCPLPAPCVATKFEAEIETSPLLETLTALALQECGRATNSRACPLPPAGR